MALITRGARAEAPVPMPVAPPVAKGTKVREPARDRMMLLGYPLSRPTFRGRRLISFLVLFAFLFSGGIIPLYLVVQDLGLINTRLSQIVPGALSLFSVILAKSFFRTTILDTLIDAAEIVPSSWWGASPSWSSTPSPRSTS